MRSSIRSLILGGLFIAMGVLFPMLFHSMGLGPIFLPMFWPIALVGFILAWPLAILTGLLTPILSFFITGMPPIPILWRMIAELGLLALITALLWKRTRWNAWLVTATSMIASALSGLGVAALLAPFLGLPSWLYAFSSLGKSLPGMILIILIIPLIHSRLEVFIQSENSRNASGS